MRSNVLSELGRCGEFALAAGAFKGLFAFVNSHVSGEILASEPECENVYKMNQSKHFIDQYAQKYQNKVRIKKIINIFINNQTI